MSNYCRLGNRSTIAVATVTNKNKKMTTDEEKSKIGKLLQGMEVPEVKLTERCSDLVKEFHKRFGGEVEEESRNEETENEVYENPYKVDRQLLEENERKLRELLSESKRVKKANSESVLLTGADPKRPWRNNSNKEKLLRVDNELKRHLEKSSQMVVPLAEDTMQELVKECKEEARVAKPIAINRLRDTVDAAKKNLPNFQYKKIDNTTATAILPQAHLPDPKNQPPKEIKID